MGPILDTMKLAYAGAAVAAGSSINADGNIIDTAGYDGCLFVAAITGSVATGVATLNVQQNTANATSGMAGLPTAQAQATSSGTNDLQGKFLAVDVYRPRERYLRCNRTSAAANITFGDVFAILYKGRKAPTIQDAVAAMAIVASPPEAA